MSYVSRVKRHYTKHTFIYSAVRSHKNVCKITCAKMETLTTEWLPCFNSLVREAKTGISSVSPAYWRIKMEWLWSEMPLITPVIPLFFNNKQCKYEKRNSNPFFNVTNRQKTKNRNGNEIPFYKAEEKRKI